MVELWPCMIVFGLLLVCKIQTIKDMFDYFQLMVSGVSLRTGRHVQLRVLPMHQHRSDIENVYVLLLKMMESLVKVCRNMIFTKCKNIFGQCKDREGPDQTAQRHSLTRAFTVCQQSHWYYRMCQRKAKTWMIICSCTGWSESAYFAHVQRHFLAKCQSCRQGLYREKPCADHTHRVMAVYLSLSPSVTFVMLWRFMMRCP